MGLLSLMVFSILHETCPNDHDLAISYVHFHIFHFLISFFVCLILTLYKKQAVLGLLIRVYHVEPAFNCQIID